MVLNLQNNVWPLHVLPLLNSSQQKTTLDNLSSASTELVFKKCSFCGYFGIITSVLARSLWWDDSVEVICTPAMTTSEPVFASTRNVRAWRGKCKILGRDKAARILNVTVCKAKVAKRVRNATDPHQYTYNLILAKKNESDTLERTCSLNSTPLPPAPGFCVNSSAPKTWPFLERHIARRDGFIRLWTTERVVSCASSCIIRLVSYNLRTNVSFNLSVKHWLAV